MYSAYLDAEYESFSMCCTKMFVRRMIRAIPKDVKERLMYVIQMSPADMSIPFPKTIDRFDTISILGRAMPIRHIINHTDALKQIAVEIGRDIRLVSYEMDNVIELRIVYSPPDDEMPPLEVG